MGRRNDDYRKVDGIGHIENALIRAQAHHFLLPRINGIHAALVAALEQVEKDEETPLGHRVRRSDKRHGARVKEGRKFLKYL
jgi:hypothetical protein